MSSAQAAASAAYRAGASANQNQSSPTRRKPALRLNIGANAPQTRPQSRTATPVSMYPRSPGIARPRRSVDERRLVDDDSAGDYFSTTPLRRVANTTPHEMLELVRKSIQSKAKTGVAKDAARKSAGPLQEFRQAVDQRRLLSLLTHELVAPGLIEDGHKLSSSLDSQTSGDDTYQPMYKLPNRSQSSFASAMSDAPPTPSIRLSESDEGPGTTLHGSRLSANVAALLAGSNNSASNSAINSASNSAINSASNSAINSAGNSAINSAGNSAVNSAGNSVANSAANSAYNSRSSSASNLSTHLPGPTSGLLTSLAPSLAASRRNSANLESSASDSFAPLASSLLPLTDFPLSSSNAVSGASSAFPPGRSSPNLAPRKDLASPIPVPPSPHAVARGMASATENISQLSLLPSSSDLALDSEKRKARRKPPPEPLDGVSSPSERSLVDLTTSDDDEIRFPQYPGISKQKRRHFFNKKRGHKDGAAYEPDLDADEPYVPIHSPAQLVPLQPVKLKTTMRKASKKKERRAFNEDKPWKNQSDLDHVSEAQRKRYEGLWVSNKGSYMDQVRTKLVGVNYNRAGRNDKKDSANDSERAAKLSSNAKVQADLSEQDMQELHGLVEVEPLELIHGAIVKRIWNRSRLLQETLAAVWDLVDFRCDGTLNKAEFIVGMWLVDQCLYGRKLPKKVDVRVWASLRNSGSVVIKRRR